MEKTENTTLKLGPSSYLHWKLSIRANLQSKNLLDYIDSDVQVPEEGSPNYASEIVSYRKKDATAQTLIINSLDNEHINLIINATNARQMYEAIVNNKEQRTTAHEWTLHRKLTDLRFTSSHTVTSYLTELDTIVKQLSDMNLEMSEKSLMIKVLDDLPAHFEQLRQTIDLAIIAGTNITFDNLRSQLLIAEQRHKADHQDKKGEALVSRNFNNNQVRHEQVVCYKCGRNGHKANVCRSGKNYKKFNSHHSNNQNHQGNGPSTSNEETANNFGNTNRNFSNNKKKFNKRFNNQQRRPNYAAHTQQQVPNTNNTVAFSMQNLDTEDCSWLLDTGASFHLSKNIESMINIQQLESPIYITVGNGGAITAREKGDMLVECFNGTDWTPCTIKDVLFAPDLGNFNLFSWGQTAKKGFGLRSTAEYTEIFRLSDNLPMIVATTYGNTFKLAIRLRNNTSNNNNDSDTECKEVALSSTVSELREWHQKLGHINVRKVLEMSKLGLIPKINIKIDLSKFACKGCLEGKMHKKPFRSKPKRICEIGEIFHCDLEGQMHVVSLGGASYALVIKDEKSSFRSVYFLKNKSDTIKSLTAHIAWVFKVTGNKVKYVRSDNGSEFVDKRVTELFANNNIEHEKTVPYNPQQNGFIERENRTLIELARSMLSHNDLPRNLWSEAMATACYLLNRIPKKDSDGVTPFELWYKRKPTYDHLHDFGSPCYGLIPPETRKKWESKCRRYLFLGYTASNENFRVYDPITTDVKILRDIKFCMTPEDLTPKINDYGVPNKQLKTWLEKIKAQDKMLEAENGETRKIENSPLITPLSETMNKTVNVDIDSESAEHAEGDANNLQALFALASIFYKDVPNTYEEAINSDFSKEWLNAMHEEMQSIRNNDTYDIVKLPEGKKPISCRWIFRIKRNIDGSIDRFKARLVARGYSQREGIDYFETFSPVARYDSIRLILSIASAHKMHILQFDVKTAFLYGTLEEEIYMNQPPGFEDGSDNVFKLKKGLYGLKQAPRQWNARIHEFLLKLNFTQSDADNCVYINNNNDIVILAIYVDDGLIASTSKNKLEEIIKKLQETFEIKHHPPQIFVGMEITQNSDRSVIQIKQTSYIKDILTRFKMIDCKPVVTPGDTNAHLIASEGCTPNIPYQEAIGALLYLSLISRPDITYQVNKLSQFNNCYNETHWTAIKRIFRYLKGTINHGITYATNPECIQPIGYCDSDYAGDLNSRKSTSGHVVTINNSPISWASRVQKSVALSTTEAEYYAITDCAKDILWYQQLFVDLAIKLIKPTIIFSDNQGAIKLSKNAVFHKRSKHVDVRMHFIRDHQSKGNMLLQYIPTSNQPADMFTKALASPALNNCKQMLNIGE